MAELQQEADRYFDLLPEFELTYLFTKSHDPVDEPAEVTILPRATIGENYTEWISADASAVIDLEACR